MMGLLAQKHMHVRPIVNWPWTSVGYFCHASRPALVRVPPGSQITNGNTTEHLGPCQTDAEVGRCVAPIHDGLLSRKPSVIISKGMCTLWRTLRPHRKKPNPRNPEISFILIRTRVTKSPQQWISPPLTRQQNKDVHPTSYIHCLSGLTERSVRHKSSTSTMVKLAPLRNVELPEAELPSLSSHQGSPRSDLSRADISSRASSPLSAGP
ncbi:hypothetical protein EDD16DRAFT_936911 [Pisolithus croceorrhizus]|nr:hypothetical protein EDD16DRAFT_936911 [Pisolithus croceorrhizus]